MSLLLFHVWPDETSNENGKAVVSPVRQLQSRQAESSMYCQFHALCRQLTLMLK